MSYYEEVEIEDLDYNPKTQTYSYPCPCGDRFIIGLDELWDGEDIAPCPSCTLRIKIVFEEENLPMFEEREDEDEESEGEEEGEVDDVVDVSKLKLTDDDGALKEVNTNPTDQ